LTFSRVRKLRSTVTSQSGLMSADARAHQFRLGLADGGKQCGQLAVDVADGHHVVIEQRQSADTGARSASVQ